MANLKDFFPDSFQKANENIVYSKLEKGTVLRIFVKDTNPPKYKILIVLGLHENKLALGTLFINSEINEFINFSEELKNLHLKLSSEEYSFLKWDSYIDCSSIQQRNNKEILAIVNKDNAKIKGYLSPEKFEEIRKLIISSETIKGKHKKQFGLYD